MAQYGIFFTQLGRDKIAAATAAEPLEITHIAVGDGGGGYPSIDDEITSLVNELGRFPVAGVSIPAPTQRQLSATIDTSIGPAVIRERGLIDSEGDLIAIAQAEPIEIPAPGGASVVDLSISIIATFNNTEHVRAVVNVQSYVRSSRSILAGTGLKGGGNLSENRTIYADIATDEEALAGESDTKLITPRKIKLVIDAIPSPVQEEKILGAVIARNWTAREPSLRNQWRSIVWSPELMMFVALSAYGGDCIMTSPDGINWTTRQTPQDNHWNGLTWSPERGMFVAVSSNGDNQVMVSYNGTIWSVREAAARNFWSSVVWCKELGIFVAVSGNGSERVMTSSDGSNWIARPNVPMEVWNSICWSPDLGMFVAVGDYKSMYSYDGISWELGNFEDGDQWRSVAWSPKLGMFAAVSSGGIRRFKTSADGINWISHLTGQENYWNSIVWSDELGMFLFVGNNSVCVSYDGVNIIRTRNVPEGNWQEVAWSPELGVFSAVTDTGANRVMTSL